MDVFRFKKENKVNKNDVTKIIDILESIRLSLIIISGCVASIAVRQFFK